MDLDRQICRQARITRDPRFDGRFFTGVRSTRIYCRSTCPVRTVREANVTYFRTAAAAEEAGYRPCLRCRPECSPGTPAWSGTSATVARALRLISEDNASEEGLEVLAKRLGIGTRQLRRLFVQHLGATPSAVVKTRRLHFAKRLIDETNLTFGEIARVSGFGSVRRFNSAFQKTYRRTPSQIRKLAPAKSLDPVSSFPSSQYDFRLSFRPPFQWQALLDFLARRAIPGVEAIHANVYLRTILMNGCTGTLRVSPCYSGSALRVAINIAEPRWLFEIIERVRRMFDLAADPGQIATQLSRDRLLSQPIKTLPGLRVPGCWDGFELAVRAILGQQISVAGASTLAGRLVQAFGARLGDEPPLTHLFPEPEKLAEADLARIGLPATRAESIRALALKVVTGGLTLNSVQDPNECRARLIEIPGVGDWTAQYIAMRALGDTDAFPASDLHLIRSMSCLNARDITRRAESWRPWRAYAAMYLWQKNGAKTKESISHLRDLKARATILAG